MHNYARCMTGQIEYNQASVDLFARLPMYNRLFHPGVEYRCLGLHVPGRHTMRPSHKAW